MVGRRTKCKSSVAAPVGSCDDVMDLVAVDVASTSSSAWQFYDQTLRKPKNILAPMVEQSELAWRILSHSHAVDLCYTPMIHSTVFARDLTYRAEFTNRPNPEHPLLAQFCANDPETLVKCVNLMTPYCDGVDLNLGCPQTIARKGNYGAFLQDDWRLIFNLVNSVHRLCSVPITCKIRIFESQEKTLRYAKHIEAAGCKLLTVHGRTRQQKGRLTGLANWDFVAAVKRELQIPVFCNGNIQLYEDVAKCIEATRADGVMSAEGHLHNPCIFEPNLHPPHWQVAEEYLGVVDRHPPSLSSVRAHLFKLFHHSLHVYPDVRRHLADALSIHEMHDVVREMRERCQPLHDSYLLDGNDVSVGGLMMPHWLCQPYYRDSSTSIATESGIAAERLRFRAVRHETLQNLADTTGWSKRRLRRLQRHKTDIDELDVEHERHKMLTTYAQRRDIARQAYVQCRCANPIGKKCEQQMCKRCCRDRCFEQKRNCSGHNFWFGDKRELYERMEQLNKKRRKLAEAEDQEATGSNHDMMEQSSDVGVSKSDDLVSA